MQKFSRHAIWAILLAGSALCVVAPSLAGPPPPPSHPHFHGAPPHWGGGPHGSFFHHDFAHFTPVEHAAWVGGSWNHSWHNGRFGWWWFAGGAWYFYDLPIYPYPGWVSDYYYYDEPDGYGPGQYWYYCQSPPGYYPYVQQCGSGWQPVPITPPPGYGAPPPGYNGPGPQDGPQGGPPPGYGNPQGAPMNGPPPGYNNGPQGDDDNGPPPGAPGYQGPPPGGPGDQGPPPNPGPNGNGPNG